jgi:predicted DNA-binding transcriptional regulator YafY
LRARTRRSRIFAPPRGDRIEASGVIDRLHAAIGSNRVLQLEYRDKSGRVSARAVEPLCLAFWGGAWTLGAWCRLREDFRNFRPDRIVTFNPTDEVFVETAERGLAAYLRHVGGDPEAAEA